MYCFQNNKDEITNKYRTIEDVMLRHFMGRTWCKMLWEEILTLVSNFSSVIIEPHLLCNHHLRQNKSNTNVLKNEEKVGGDEQVHIFISLLCLVCN